MSGSRAQRPKLGYRQRCFLFGIFIFAVLGSIFLCFYLATGREISPILSDLQAVDAPLSLDLGQNLGYIDTAKCRIYPEVAGRFEYRSRLSLKGDILQFIPDSEFQEGTRYTVTIDGIERLVFGDETAREVSFVTTGPPVIVGMNISEGAVIPMDTKILVELSSPPDGQRDLVLKTEPELEWSSEFDGDKSYSFSPASPLPGGIDLKITVYDNITGTDMATLALRTAAPPEMSSPAKLTDVTPGDELTITFSEPMEAYNSLITFNLEGTGDWRDETTYIFKPSSLAAGQTYSYTLRAGLRTKAGGILLADTTHEFSARGAVTVVGKSPQGSGKSQAKQTIKFTFAYPVDHASAESLFGVSAGSISGFSWDGNTLVATVVNMGYQQTVSAWVGAGVRPAGFGLPSVAKSTVSFTTESRTTMLNIPFYRQTYAQSCEESALRSGMAYRGVYTDDWDILQRVGYNPRPRDGDNWDNPNHMFVGDVNGSQKNGTGYGAFWGPIASTGRSYGVNTVAKSMNVSDIASEIHAGNPVIVWTVMSGATWQTWHTPQGDVSVPLPIHVKIIYGVRGEPWSPQTFYAWDPIYGKMTYSASNLRGVMFGSAVVVY